MLVAVVEQLGGAFGESGFLVIPCVAAHINQVLIAKTLLLCHLLYLRVISNVCNTLQIIIDSIIVNWWRQKDQQFTSAK